MSWLHEGHKIPTHMFFLCASKILLYFLSFTPANTLTLGMATSVHQSVSHHFGLDWNISTDILDRYSWLQEDESYWLCWDPEFSSATTMRLTFQVWSQMSWLQTLMCPSGWIVINYFSFCAIVLILLDCPILWFMTKSCKTNDIPISLSLFLSLVPIRKW